MTWIRRLLYLQILLCALAGLRGLLPGCDSCGGGLRAGDLAVGLLGAATYAFLWILANHCGGSRWLAIGIGAAAGIHGALLLRMLTDRLFCLPCAMVAGVAFILFALYLATQATHRIHLIGAAAAGFALLAIPSLHRPPTSLQLASIDLTVYEHNDCPYCEELRTTHLPRLEEEFKHRLRITFLSATETSWVERTPTIVIHGAEKPEVIEGLPPFGFLRGTIARHLHTPEGQP